MQNAPGWPPGFGGSHPTYPTPASVAAQQMAWQQQQPPQPPALAPQQPAWQPAVFPPQQQATQPELKETLAQAPGLHFAMQSPAQSAPQPEQPMAQVGQSAAGAEQTAPPLNAVMSEAAQAHNNWPAGFQQVAPPPQMEPLEAAEFTAMINEASSHIG
ncbi:hypothetical protein COCSUDRAFT_33915 [Coccomyxa subellipsoidea C-169]|uniref:Uncharacterized protein n=1 Tax=Coccomyxa subellipsoidea (strain C-169) TaxID=574566 RepID=I0YR34_COCSC|nr:hypothetical protein COCSUDRAFT_33915 [Coccomyxa subellipsoidea C-169]EIE20853.1 hypothetical protein COCSUDRAFT_33915 [Coccomyxa subellipsoidea C-169]|eukprot:XP_005645397.1 hypothetical protein COCSUDRAFT_33915 [Coccomyxa subellipsoidea C-169]